MANYIGLDKGMLVLATYNSSAAAGVTAFRCVKYSVSGSTTFVDLQTSASAGALSIGVVQDALDQVDVATGKATANVRIGGITKVYANTTPGAIAIGSKVMCGSAGGVILAATSGSAVLGICVGMSVPGGTVAAGDLIDVLLTPGLLVP